MSEVVYHNSYEMGTAPYKLKSIWSAGGINRPSHCHNKCDHCGTYIKHHYNIEDTNGKMFAVGSSCIGKLNDHSLIKAVDAARRKLAKEVRRQKQIAKLEERRKAVEIELQKERDKNGGMTDYQLAKYTKQMQGEVIYGLYSKSAEYFIAALDNCNGFFGPDVSRGLKQGTLPRGGGVSITKEIAAKYHSGARKNSKKYKEEMEITEKRWDEMVTTLESVSNKISVMDFNELRETYPEYFI
jgi:hypothetical protein